MVIRNHHFKNINRISTINPEDIFNDAYTFCEKNRDCTDFFIYNGQEYTGKLCMKDTSQDIIDLYHDVNHGKLIDQLQRRGDVGIIHKIHLDYGKCLPLLCDENEYVSNHTRLACPPGTYNAPGDDASSDTNTTCDAIICDVGYGVENHRCVICDFNTYNPDNFDASGGDRDCYHMRTR